MNEGGEREAVKEGRVQITRYSTAVSRMRITISRFTQTTDGAQHPEPHRTRNAYTYDPEYTYT